MPVLKLKTDKMFTDITEEVQKFIPRMQDHFE